MKEILYLRQRKQKVVHTHMCANDWIRNLKNFWQAGRKFKYSLILPKSNFFVKTINHIPCFYSICADYRKQNYFSNYLQIEVI